MSTSNICYFVEKGTMPETRSLVIRAGRWLLVWLLACWTVPVLAIVSWTLNETRAKKLGLALRACIRAITED